MGEGHSKADPASKGAAAAPAKAVPASGDGIRSIRTTSVFQIVNFELYAKPNMMVMGFGLVAITLSAAYLAYLKASLSGTKTYIAINEDGSQSLLEKKSKWE